MKDKDVNLSSNSTSVCSMILGDSVNPLDSWLIIIKWGWSWNHTPPWLGLKCSQNSDSILNPQVRTWTRPHCLPVTEPWVLLSLCRKNSSEAKWQAKSEFVSLGCLWHPKLAYKLAGRVMGKGEDHLLPHSWADVKAYIISLSFSPISFNWNCYGAI